MIAIDDTLIEKKKKKRRRKNWLHVGLIDMMRRLIRA